MTQRHVINLSTAWEPPGGDSRTWVRQFGLPSGVAAEDRVWLVHAGGRNASLVLNGVPLTGLDGRHDVTTLLRARNELALTPADGDTDDARDPSAAMPPPRSHGRRPLDACHGRLVLEIEHGLP